MVFLVLCNVVEKQLKNQGDCVMTEILESVVEDSSEKIDFSDYYIVYDEVNKDFILKKDNLFDYAMWLCEESEATQEELKYCNRLIEKKEHENVVDFLRTLDICISDAVVKDFDKSDFIKKDIVEIEKEIDMLEKKKRKLTKMLLRNQSRCVTREK